MILAHLAARSLRIATLLGAGGVLAASPAAAQLAQPDGISNELRAEQLFRSGERRFDAGQHEAACADFAESLRLGPKLGTLLNLALCHETVGRTATAWSEFHHGAAWAAQNGQRDRHDFAVMHALALEPRLPRVLLKLPADRALSSVDIDGEPLADSRWYLPVFLDPGEHSVSISSPGKVRGTVKFRVVASPTEQLVSVPALQDDAGLVAQAKPLPVAGSDPDRMRRVAGTAAVATGAAGVALGLVFGALAVDKRDEIGARCAGNVCNDAGAKLYREAQSRATVATVSTVIGLLAGSVGGWLLFTSRPAEKAHRGRAAIALDPLRGGATLGLQGAFR
jgi:hypothetical protein